MTAPDPETSSDRPAPTGSSPWTTAVRSAVGNLLVAADTLVLGSIASVAGWIPPRGVWMYVLARFWSRLNLWICGVRLEVEFEAPLDPDRGYIFMANHRSMFDIPVLIASIPGQSRFMAKKSLFKVPVFGWALKAGDFIPVDRGNKEAAKNTYRAAIDRISKGRSILIFPEQTRSLGDEMLPFKRGGVVIAEQTGAPIVPVGILGTRKIRPKGSNRIVPGTVKVRYGRPITVEDFGELPQEERVARVRAEIERLLARP